MLEPTAPRSTDQMRSIYEEHIDEVDRVVAWVARRGFQPDEAQEFRSWVHVELMDDDFRVLRAYTGRASLSTYLVAVVQNLARDFRSRRWGRWRPSAAAERLGVTAIRLERLLDREGHSLSAATEMLQRHFGVRLSALEIASLAEQLPPRQGVVLEGGERAADLEEPSGADQATLRAEGESTLDEAREAIAACLEDFDVDDRLVLKMHYERGLTVAAIAASLGLGQRRLYTRRDRCLRDLRSSLEKRGLDAARILDALRWVDRDRPPDFRVHLAEERRTEPSNLAEGADLDE